VPLSVVTVGTLLCTGAAARSERTASTGAWRESSDDTGREARSARLKEAAMVSARKKLGDLRDRTRRKPPRWHEAISPTAGASIAPEKECTDELSGRRQLRADEGRAAPRER
jgi:hypothetical protein